MRNTDNRTLQPDQVKQVVSLILSSATHSLREISRVTGVSKPSVLKIQHRINILTAEQKEGLAGATGNEIMGLLYSKNTGNADTSCRNNKGGKYIPDFKKIAEKMVETKMSKRTAYEEYLQEAEERKAETLSLGHFYRKLDEELSEIMEPDNYYMIQKFEYGEQLQADFTGDRYQLNTYHGLVNCWIFVLCFPASYYCYAGFVTGQSTEESCRVIGNAVRFFGNRVPRLLVSDNARAFVNYHKGGSYIVNESFENYLAELGICFIPTPVRAPRDKSAAEHSVNMVQRMIKNHNFSFNGIPNTIDGHSRNLQTYVEKYINNAPFRRNTEKTRSWLFASYELPKLRSVTSIPEYQAKIKSVVVPRSYHIKLNNHSYSVPYTHIGRYVDVYMLNDYVIIKYEGKEIARHLRAPDKDTGSRITTITEHMPPVHRKIKAAEKYLLTPDDILHYASSLDEKVYKFCEKRLSYAGRNPELYMHNAITSCRSVINFYESEQYKELISEACEDILHQSSAKWCIKEIKKIYFSRIKEEEARSGKSGQRKKMINRTDTTEAFMRDDGSDELSGDSNLN